MNTSQWITIFQLLALVSGIKELWAAREYYKQQKKKWAIASFCMGIFACSCVIISFTGIL